MRVLTLAVVLVTGWPDLSKAQTTDQGHFALFNDCAPIDFVVSTRKQAAAIDLTEERIQVLVESRLRGARLHDATAVPYLRVDVGVVSDAWVTRLAFRRLLTDSDRSGIATTWEDLAYGLHSGDAGYILQVLSEGMDRFILEYLRANDTACNPAAPPADPR